MANVKGNGNLAVYTLDASSMLGVINGVSYELDIDQGETTTISRTGKRRQSVKKSARISFSAMDTHSSDSGLVQSNLSISAFAIGGQSYLAYLRGGSFKASYDVRETSGVADAFKWPQIFGKDYTAEVTLVLPADADSQTPDVLRNLSPSLHDADIADQDLNRVVFTITNDDLTFTLPMSVKSIKVDIQGQGEQVVTLSLEGVDPGTGDYPTAPTGTTSMIENALNDFNTAIAVVLTTSAVGKGVSFAGNFIITDFGFSFNDAEITKYDFVLSSRGAITGATV